MVRRNRKKINENTWRDVKIQKETKKGRQTELTRWMDGTCRDRKEAHK